MAPGRRIIRNYGSACVGAGVHRRSAGSAGRGTPGRRPGLHLGSRARASAGGVRCHLRHKARQLFEGAFPEAGAALPHPPRRGRSAAISARRTCGAASRGAHRGHAAPDREHAPARRDPRSILGFGRRRDPAQGAGRRPSLPLSDVVRTRETPRGRSRGARRRPAGDRGAEDASKLRPHRGRHPRRACARSPPLPGGPR